MSGSGWAVTTTCGSRGNDYSVDPTVIGRFVDVHAGLTTVTIHCTGAVVGVHQRCWSSHQTITDPAHVITAGVLRTAFKARTTATRVPAGSAGPGSAMGSTGNGVGAAVAVRALSDYDDLFALTPAAPALAVAAASTSLVFGDAVAGRTCSARSLSSPVNSRHR